MSLLNSHVLSVHEGTMLFKCESCDENFVLLSSHISSVVLVYCKTKYDDKSLGS